MVGWSVEFRKKCVNLQIANLFGSLSVLCIKQNGHMIYELN